MTLYSSFIAARLDQYASLLSYEFDETTANNVGVTTLGVFYASEFSENVGIGTTLYANVFPPYDIVYDEFAGVSYGPGKGVYMRHNTDKTVVVYNEIDEMTDIYGSVTVAIGQTEFTTAGTYTWTVPVGVTSVSVVCIGGGGGGASGRNAAGGGGGALRYVNNIAVNSNQTLTIVVGSGGLNEVAGATSSVSISGTVLCSAAGGLPGSGTVGGAGGSTGVGTGGNGGSSPNSGIGGRSSGGGGAGGYSGNGGNGGTLQGDTGYGSTATGGGGGGGAAGDVFSGGGGGGVGIFGEGVSGIGGTFSDASGVDAGGKGGSGGTDGGEGNVFLNDGGVGGLYGGGGGGSGDIAGIGGFGRRGAVRIIWGPDRAFPSTNTQNI